MGNFNRGNRSGSGRGFGGGRSGGGRRFGGGGGGRSMGRPQMHQATCSECGEECEVPFRPSSDKPVYCDNCFSSKKGGNPRRPDRGGRDFGDRANFDDKQMHDAICDSCGDRCQVPFKPTSGKPVYCSECFEKEGGGSKRNNRDNNRSERPARSDNNHEIEQIKTELFALNTKMDNILHILNKSTSPEKPFKKEVEMSEAKKDVKNAKKVKTEKPEKTVTKKKVVVKKAKKAKKK